MNVIVRSLDFAHSGPTGSTTVFRSFDLDVQSRSMHAIVGPSGCGKSSLLRLIAGLERPHGGTIRVGSPADSSFDANGRASDGRASDGLASDGLASDGTPRLEGAMQPSNRVALVFQDPTLVPWWTVGRNAATSVEFDRRRRSLYDRVRTFSLDRVGLTGLADRQPNTLSRGQQTRVSIARAMAHDAGVTLLDEPFVHLDAITRRRMWEEFETHWQFDARTYVLVTHDIEEAVLLSDRVTVLSGSTPTTTVATIEIGIDRPRGPGRLTEPAFKSSVAEVWEALGGAR